MSEESATYKGKVVWFNVKAGYGFISRTDADGNKLDDIFVHFSDIKCGGFKSLKAEDEVEFSIGQNNEGRDKAIDVVVIK
jgi:CspA family cold shock protein